MDRTTGKLKLSQLDVMMSAACNTRFMYMSYKNRGVRASECCAVDVMLVSLDMDVLHR